MEKSPRKLNALILRPASLPAETKALIQIATPAEFIKTRPGKGGKSFTYIEGGYVIARLNQVFSPVGWDFEVINERVEPNEVIVRGKLTVKDHKNGFTISKTQYGTRDRNAGVPLGDTFKAASTDCLKKCASLFGIGLDVYWQQLDEDKLTAQKPKVVDGKVVPTAPSKNASKPQTKAEFMRLSLEKIAHESDETILSQFFERIQASTLYTEAEKHQLIKAIAEQRKKYAKGNQTQTDLFGKKQ